MQILDVQEQTSTFVAEERETMFAKSRVVLFSVSLTIILLLSIGTQVLSLNEPAEQPTLVRPFQPEREGMRVSGTPHTPIIIDGDVNFNATALAEGWVGNGTYGNPFIVEGLDIDLGGAPGSCISISNTRVHFVIRDCNLTGASVSPGSGIYLFNVANSVLINNICTSNYYGIYLSNSDSNTVANNTCTGNTNGIYLSNSDSNIVANNTCTSVNNCIVLSNSVSNSASNNTCTDSWRGILITGIGANTVSDNTITNNGEGISLVSSDSNTVTNNILTSNEQGIYLYTSDSNTVKNNNCTSNDIGIVLEDSITNTVSYNTLASSSTHGIFLLTSDLNDFRWNVFTNNSIECYDGGSGNTFLFNYWESYSGPDVNQDGFGDTPHTFTSNSDPYPLVYLPTSPTWTQSPVDQFLELGFFEFYYDLNVTTSIPISWHLNSTLFSVDSEGVVTSWVILPIGIYGLEVVVTNNYNRSLTSSFRVIIQDMTAPHWIIEPSDQVLQHGEGLDYQLPVADLSGVEYWTLNDTSHFTLTAALYHGGSTARIVNAIPLDTGVYGLNVTVYDQHGNKLSAIFSVIVEANLPSTPPGGIDPFMILAIGVGLGGVGVFAIVMVVLRKRS